MGIRDLTSVITGLVDTPMRDPVYLKGYCPGSPGGCELIRGLRIPNQP